MLYANDKYLWNDYYDWETRKTYYVMWVNILPEPIIIKSEYKLEDLEEFLELIKDELRQKGMPVSIDNIIELGKRYRIFEVVEADAVVLYLPEN